MAKRLGFGPDALIHAIPSPKQKWKLPVKYWIHELHEKNFGYAGRDYPICCSCSAPTRWITTAWRRSSTYYPGGAWAEIVSVDTYNHDLNLAGDERGYQHYLALVSTGKPFGLSEFGQSFDDSTGPNASAWDARTVVQRVRDSYPRTAFAVAWYSSVEDGSNYVFALPDVSFTGELLRDPLIQTK